MDWDQVPKIERMIVYRERAFLSKGKQRLR
jgi:hypothetical protein